MPSNLELKFDEKMRQIYDQAKDECGYTAIRFMQMVAQHGGLGAAKQLLNSQGYSEGLTRLWEMKRLDISMEATVLQEPWCQLFTQEELDRSRAKLDKLGFDVNQYIVP